MSKLKSVLFSVVAIVCFVVAQLGAFLLSSFKNESLAILGIVIQTIFYPYFTYLLLKFSAEKIFKVELTNFRIAKPNFKWYWVVVAFTMPVLVILLFQFVDGSWCVTSKGSLVRILRAIFYSGFAGGIVEEMVFRGVILGSIERSFNKVTAVIVPSVIFGLFHLIGAPNDMISTILLIVSGTLVGIVFSLITIESNNFWNSALVHSLWNIITSLFLCSAYQRIPVAYLYLLKSDSTILTGGVVGSRASVFSMISYSLAGVLALVFIKRRGRIK